MPADQELRRKADAARAAMDRLASSNPRLREKIVKDFSAAGFRWSVSVAADVGLVSAIDPAGASALKSFLTDQRAVAFEVSRGLGPFRGALDPVGDAASGVGNLPKDILPAVGDALTPVSVVGFLSALSDPDTWLRVAQVVLGGVLVVVGVARMAGVSPQQITKVLPAGKAASLAKGR